MSPTFHFTVNSFRNTFCSFLHYIPHERCMTHLSCGWEQRSCRHLLPFSGVLDVTSLQKAVGSRRAFQVFHVSSTALPRNIMNAQTQGQRKGSLSSGGTNHSPRTSHSHNFLFYQILKGGVIIRSFETKSSWRTNFKCWIFRFTQQQ